MKNQFGKSVYCNKCGWSHFEVDADYVKDWSSKWIDFWLTSTPKTRENYGCKDSPPGPEQYFKCFNCGNSYIDFSDGTVSLMNGNTVQPIMNRLNK